LAFRNREPLITENASLPGLQNFVAPPGKKKSYDDTAYTSFAAFPIGPMGDGGAPYGVLVATSSQVGRFDTNTARILMHVADVFACIFYLAYDPTELKAIANDLN